MLCTLLSSRAVASSMAAAAVRLRHRSAEPRCFARTEAMIASPGCGHDQPRFNLRPIFWKKIVASELIKRRELDEDQFLKQFPIL
jgi:hypothetical protein